MLDKLYNHRYRAMAANILKIPCPVCNEYSTHLLCNACCGKTYCQVCFEIAADAYPGDLMTQPNTCKGTHGTCEVFSRIVEECAKANARQAAHEEYERQLRAEYLLAKQRLEEERARETPEQRAAREAAEAAADEAQRQADIAASEARGEKYWDWGHIENPPENRLTMADIMAARLNNN